MTKYRKLYKQYAMVIFWSMVIISTILLLYLYRLGSIPGGMSARELLVANGIFGWHGLSHSLLYLPLNVLRSILFFIVGSHGQYLTRLPNAIFGIMSIIGFGWLLWLWHGTRTAVLGTALFACSAWTLHVSRVATSDVMFLWSMIALLVSNAVLHRYAEKLGAIYAVLSTWLLLLFVPGMIWLLLINIFWQRNAIIDAWQAQTNRWIRGSFIGISLIGFGVLFTSLFIASDWIEWLGLPSHFTSPLTIVRDFLAIPYHIYLHGPLLPDVWLGRLAILDILAIVFSVIGLYFYIINFGSGRSRVLASFLAISLLLISLGGAVSISLILPLFYVLIATGIAYVLREWLKIFPLNPFARSVGIAIIIIAVALSCLYNTRAYFVAWQHNPNTQTIFRFHRS